MRTTRADATLQGNVPSKLEAPAEFSIVMKTVDPLAALMECAYAILATVLKMGNAFWPKRNSMPMSGAPTRHILTFRSPQFRAQLEKT